MGASPPWFNPVQGDFSAAKRRFCAYGFVDDSFAPVTRKRKRRFCDNSFSTLALMDLIAQRMLGVPHAGLSAVHISL